MGDDNVVVIDYTPPNTVIIDEAASTVVIVQPPVQNVVTVDAPAPPTLVVQGPVEPYVIIASGEQGPPGPAFTTFTKIAGVDLSGQRLVVPRSDGTVIYADNATSAHTSLPVWITLGAASMGTPVQVTALGEVTEPSWSWTPEGSIFLGANGVLTQIVPSSPALFIEQVAVAETATSIFFDPKIPLRLA